MVTVFLDWDRYWDRFLVMKNPWGVIIVRNSLLKILVGVSVFGFMGCESRMPRIGDTYPGEMAVLSKFPLPIRIVDCEGLGSAQPGGIVTVHQSGDNYPQKISSYPRLKFFPSSFTIRWRSAARAEDLVGSETRDTDLTQRIDLPQNLKGTKARLLFVLDDKGVWSVSCASEEDWEKPYVIKDSQK